MAEQTGNKAKTCIICGGSAGSREHVFPAILGGRRTNKGIYCDTHNQEFGSLVAVLGKQFEMLNALLMVRPDRRNAPKPSAVTAHDGVNYELAGLKLSMPSPPPLNSSGLTKGDKFDIAVSDHRQLAQWQKAQKKQGWEAKISGEGTPGRTYLVAPVHARLKFGGDDAFQAVAYLALTYFAQYFPMPARDGSRRQFKERLALDLNTVDGKSAWKILAPCVWWEKHDFDELLNANPFSFGHTIVVGISKQEKNAYAFISFFSTFNYGVDLGPVTEDIEGMQTVYVNPLAESALGDITEVSAPEFTLELKHDENTLRESLSDGRFGELMSKLMTAINAKNYQIILEEIEFALSHMPPSSPKEVAHSLVEKFSQGILMLLAEVSSLMSEKMAQTYPKNANQFHQLFAGLVQADDTQPDKLAPVTSAHLLAAKSTIAEAISEELQKPITDKTKAEIRALLAEGPGMAKIGEKVFMPLVLQTLGI